MYRFRDRSRETSEAKFFLLVDGEEKENGGFEKVNARFSPPISRKTQAHAG